MRFRAFALYSEGVSTVSKTEKLLLVVIVLISLSACVLPPVPRQYDLLNPLKKVAVLPLKNDTVDVDAPDFVRKKMIEALEAKSYIVEDILETDRILRDQMGINLGGQLDLATPQTLGEALGVEGVLYGTLMDFNETTTGLVDVRKVRAKFKLVNAQTGHEFWQGGIGVRSETRMAGTGGTVAALAARGADARDAEVPWVTIDSNAIHEKNLGKALALGIGKKLLSKAIGIHLEHETKAMVRLITKTMPWGPGPGTRKLSAFEAYAEMPGPVIEALTLAAPPSFVYLDYGNRDFSAVLVSVTVDKSSAESMKFKIPLAKAGDKIRMDMETASMARGGQEIPPAFSTMTTIHHGDKKLRYVLYPNAKKYMIQKDSDGRVYPGDVLEVEKEKIGSEIVGAHPTDKYRVKISYSDGKMEEGLVWNAKDLDGMTIKSEVENQDAKVTTELTNISLKKQSASLFEVPADYTEAQGFRDLMMDAGK